MNVTCDLLREIDQTLEPPEDMEHDVETVT